MEATIEVDAVSKRFGQTLALDELSFHVVPGSVTGFVGPHGAGKSTTMRIILERHLEQMGLMTAAATHESEAPARSLQPLPLVLSRSAACTAGDGAHEVRTGRYCNFSLHSVSP
jgi:ABC-type transporter Mla maintaining outer membrane lipid asymmetry ATPase subunit MlaF